MNKRAFFRSVLTLVFTVAFLQCSDDPADTFVPVRKQPDLGVSFIHRTPEIDFVWGSSNPLVDGWPTSGQAIAWEGYIFNDGKEAVSNVAYSWKVNGVEVKSGTVSLAAGQHTVVTLDRAWTFSREEIVLVIDPSNTLGETNRQNNELLVFSDALSVGFYVERSVFRHYLSNPDFLPKKVNTWYDWARFQMDQFNDLFATHGVTERLRLDFVTLVDDGQLPGIFSPNLSDKTVDIQFGFLSKINGFDNTGFYDDLVKQGKPSGYLLHEMLHARYLLDNYSFNVLHQTNNSRVLIEENGVSVVGSAYMPAFSMTMNGIPGWQVYTEGEGDLMSSVDNLSLSQFTSRCINYLKGHRATQGNYNSPSDFHRKFPSLIPNENVLLVKDKSGAIVPDASVSVYRSTQVNYGEPGVYAKTFDNEPDVLLTTDAEGKVSLGANPFGDGEYIPQSVAYSGGTLIIRIQKGDKVGYTFLSGNRVINEYLGGATEVATYTVSVNML